MQCQPLHKFWHPDVAGTCPLTPMMSLFGSAIPHFVLEVAILLSPLVEIWRLQISFARKVAVAAMFASGLLYVASRPLLRLHPLTEQSVCGSALGSILHTVALYRKGSTDLTLDGVDDQIWAVCDVNLASFASPSYPLSLPELFR
jgi:hypothetical protein